MAETVAAVRTLLVDDHPLFRQGLRQVMSGRDIEVVGEASDGDSALQMFTNENGCTGLSALTQARSLSHPRDTRGCWPLGRKRCNTRIASMSTANIKRRSPSLGNASKKSLPAPRFLAMA